MQSLGKNKIFGDRLKSVDWVSKINLKKSREEKIRECFNYTTIEFHYPDNLPDFYMFLETFQKDAIDDEDKQETTDKDNNNCNIFGKKKKFDKLIVMEDVLGLEDKSNGFSNFLTVSQKFAYIYLYNFHIIYPSKSV